MKIKCDNPFCKKSFEYEPKYVRKMAAVITVIKSRDTIQAAEIIKCPYCQQNVIIQRAQTENTSENIDALRRAKYPNPSYNKPLFEIQKKKEGKEEGEKKNEK